ncbi:MAG: PilZ domain-containing protein [Deltaproteobacteria bacterium]|nr:PilZ domain-containing protein [Deltaproteobacteria bacterium]
MIEKEEKRRLPRAEVTWPVTLFYEDEEFTGESRNISQEGLFICCEKPLVLNKIYRLYIKPPYHKAIGVTGKVIWSDLYGIGGDNSTYGIGICLMEFSEKDKKILEELVSVYL